MNLVSHVIIRRLHGVEELEDARHVCDSVWPSVAGGTEITQNLITAMEHAGGYMSAAYLQEAPHKPVGAVVSFLGRHKEADGQWHTHLHSHMTAVLESVRDKSIGTLLKRDQRLWAIDNGIETITWTFDPLVRRNARLNLIKLGADVSEYLVNFYGAMQDQLNHGDDSDRLMAAWHVTSERANAAAAGTLKPLTEIPHGAIVVELPEDIVALRQADMAAAKRWRLQVREQLTTALAEGYELVGLDVNDSYVFKKRD